MNTTKTSTKITHPDSIINSWDSAIAEAERRIAEAKNRLAVLRRSAVRLRAFRDAGEPWPGTSEVTEKVAERASST